MKIAICINQSSVGGVGTSTYILASGMLKAGHHADILATHCRYGPDYERARRDGWPVEALAHAITQFYRIPQETYLQMAEKARRHVVSVYDCEKCGRQLYEKYAGLIQKNNAIKQ